jgi:hypothetical protein
VGTVVKPNAGLWWVGWDHLQEDLVKFGYRLERILEKNRILVTFWQHLLEHFV